MSAVLRGYIGSRTYFGKRYPHRVQNTMIRDYCRRFDYTYQLSATEVSIPDSHLVLSDVLTLHDEYDGLAFFSVFLLPMKLNERQEVYRLVREYSKTIHFVLEQIVIQTEENIKSVELLLGAKNVLQKAPISGDYNHIISGVSVEWKDFAKICRDNLDW